MKLLVLPADGIGPEITDAALTVLRTADRRFGLDLAFDFDDAGFPSLKKHGTTLRQELLERAKTYDGTILGTQSHADYPPPEQGGRNISAGFRVGLDLYANVRPARTRPFLESNMKPGKHMDVKEANVFHLDDKGQAFEFWGVAENQAEINSFWMD